MAGNSPTVDVDGDRVLADQSLDVVYGLLADQRRRCIFACLADQTGSLSRRDLAKDVASLENSAPVSEIPDDTVENVSISLVHKDLPKLTEAGIVEYDQDSDVVRPAETTDRVGDVLSQTLRVMTDPAEDRCLITLGED